jgi:CheY-like chemotaxis protein
MTAIPGEFDAQGVRVRCGSRNSWPLPKGFYGCRPGSGRLSEIKAARGGIVETRRMSSTAQARPRITVVEDDVSLLNALAFALEADGFAVAAYTAAAPLLARPPSADCMVVDLRLPDMDGLSLIAALRALGPQPRAILITTNPDARLRLAAAKVGVEIVEKPLIGGELRQRIAEAVRQPIN